MVRFLTRFLRHPRHEFLLLRLPARLRHAVRSRLGWMRWPVRKDPGAWLPSWRKQDYYWLKYYPEPLWPAPAGDARLAEAFRLFAWNFYEDRFGLKVLGRSIIDPVNGSARRVKGGWPEGVERLDQPACLFRLSRIEDELNYYHFHFDLIGKLKMADDCGIDPKVPFVVSKPCFESKLFQAASQRGGLAGRRWVCDQGRSLGLERAILLKAPPISRELMEYIQFQVGAPRPDPRSGRRIYARRTGAVRRKIVNGDEIAALALRHDFEVVDPAAMTYEEQLSTFSQARYWILDHGACTANIALRCGAPLSLLELLSHEKQPPHVFWMCRSFGADYHALIGEPPASARNAEETTDYILDPQSFEDSVRRLLR